MVIRSVFVAMIAEKKLKRNGTILFPIEVLLRTFTFFDIMDDYTSITTRKPNTLTPVSASSSPRKELWQMFGPSIQLPPFPTL